MRYTALTAAFEALWLSRLTGLIRHASQARGIIFTLHRVLPEPPADFAPNAILQVRPDFLEFVIGRIRQLGFDIVGLDEALARLAAEPRPRRFAVFTFDDAYRDNLRYALPILRRNECPFTLFVPTALVDGVGEVWWQALEDIIASRDAMRVGEAGEVDYVRCATLAEKYALYFRIYAQMRAMAEPDRVAFIRELAIHYDLDLSAHCRALIMDWQELKIFADEPLCTIGAHTVHHYELAKLPAAKAVSEIEGSLKVLEAQFGARPAHVSYPIGGRASAGPREYQLAKELGLRSGVTTLPGGLYRRHLATPHALPRVSLNGGFQRRRYVDVYGAPAVFDLIDRLGRLWG